MRKNRIACGFLTRLARAASFAGAAALAIFIAASTTGCVWAQPKHAPMPMGTMNMASPEYGRRVAGARLGADMAKGSRGVSSEPEREERMLIRQASLEIEARDLPGAIRSAEKAVGEAGGFVQDSNTNEDHAGLNIRVPSARLDVLLDALAALGKVRQRSIGQQDVTGQMVDMEAALKNKIALRDRLRTLLDRASDVKDVLAIEEQLTRLQTEIDSIEGNLKHIKKRVEMSAVMLNITRKQTLGPLGYLFKGLGWGIEKLFVID